MRALFFLLCITGTGLAQQQRPYIGYVYPAGGQRGTTLTVEVGGQHLEGVTGVVTTGAKIVGELRGYVQPPQRGRLNRLRQKLRELREKRRTGNATRQRGDIAARSRQERQLLRRLGLLGVSDEDFAKVAEGLGIRHFTRSDYIAWVQKTRDPKYQPNEQLAETVTLELRIEEDAEPGLVDFRLRTRRGLTAPLRFAVDLLPELVEREPNDAQAMPLASALPFVINGRVQPGEVDRFRFHLDEGAVLHARLDARRLVPYLADAVPGWFQATLTLQSVGGERLRFVDDFRFDPDPVLEFRAPRAGDYVLEVRDAIYRGRDDFVYRLALEQGVPDREEAPLTVPEAWSEYPALPEGATVQRPEHKVRVPSVVRGCIQKPGEVDVYSFHAAAGQEIVLEVHARRGGSPLDSVIEVRDRAGKRIVWNDDFVDRGHGLLTHHADSFLSFRAKRNGMHTVRIRDTRAQGSPDHRYCLRIARSEPAYSVRIVPSTVLVRPGGSAVLEAHVQRREGFAGDVEISLADAPAGWSLAGACVPEDRERVRFTVTAPADAKHDLTPLQFTAVAREHGRRIETPALPAEDRMQAFLWRHLVVADEFLAEVAGGRPGRAPRLAQRGPLRIPVGGSTTLRLEGAPARLAKQLQFALKQGPTVLSIGEVRVRSRGVLEIELRCERSADPGQRGNLLIEAQLLRKRGPPGKVRTQRVPLALLPAVPFELSRRSGGV